MEVFELHYPGIWLRNIPDPERFNVETLLRILERKLDEAAIGLAFFKEAQERPEPWVNTPESKECEARARIIAQEMRSQLPRDLSPEQKWKESVAIPGRASLQARREQWAAGRVPRSYENQLQFIHAHTVLYALDTIGKTLDTLSRMQLPADVADAREGYRSALPGLTAVRDSAHHVEHRALGLDRNDRPLTLQPIENESINAPFGMLTLESLRGDILGYTASDGHLREVGINSSSVTAAQAAIQQVLNALTWHGPARTTPELDPLLTEKYPPICADILNNLRKGQDV